MPELPEVETTLRGIAPHVLDKTILQVTVRDARLRWPVSADLADRLRGKRFDGVRRRAKYLLLDFDAGTLMIHLGMSGSLAIATVNRPLRKHDHIDIVFADGLILRFNDPRRFGSFTLLDSDTHPLLADLGAEPLSKTFDVDYLYRRSRGRKLAVKPFIMDQSVVVGVGNIYACESLFRAGISPRRAAGQVSLRRYSGLVEAIRNVLQEAIQAGGTTLRDFTRENGQPGYFKQSLQVYGRQGQACDYCGRKLKLIRQGQRSTVYCGFCQK